MRTVGFTPPCKKQGCALEQVHLHTSIHRGLNKPLPKKKFYFKLGLEFVDTKSKEKVWLDILCVGR